MVLVIATGPEAASFAGRAQVPSPMQLLGEYAPGWAMHLESGEANAVDLKAFLALPEFNKNLLPLHKPTEPRPG
jgi:hypothetical protein